MGAAITVSITRVSFSTEDFAAAKRSMACHRSQHTPEVIERVSAAAGAAWNNVIPLVPVFSAASETNLFPLDDLYRPAESPAAGGLPTANARQC